MCTKVYTLGNHSIRSSYAAPIVSSLSRARCVVSFEDVIHSARAVTSREIESRRDIVIVRRALSCLPSFCGTRLIKFDYNTLLCAACCLRVCFHANSTSRSILSFIAVRTRRKRDEFLPFVVFVSSNFRREIFVCIEERKTNVNREKENNEGC